MSEIVLVKKEKRRVFNFKRFSVFLIVLFLIIYFSIDFINSKINNIFIRGNDLLSDQYIIDLAEISDYPKFFFTRTSSIKKRLLKDDFIKDVSVKKDLGNKIVITVVENKVLYYDFLQSDYILLDGTPIKMDKIYLGIPTLVNEIPKDIKNRFRDELANVEKSVIEKISEIEYSPDNVDDERFLLSMTDGNYVYLTLINFEIINRYDDVIKQIEGKKGIIYLDSGFYFEEKN